LQTIDLEFDGNAYNEFFFFPKPQTNSEFYEECRSFIADNYSIPRAGQDASRALQIHTCFEPCRSSGDCLTGFDFDMRDGCTKESRESGILCVNPYVTECETYVEPLQYCFDDAQTICIDWRKIVLAVVITNILQVIFEASMLYALEVSLKPTYLDKLQNNDEMEEDP